MSHSAQDFSIMVATCWAVPLLPRLCAGMRAARLTALACSSSSQAAASIIAVTVAAVRLAIATHTCVCAQSQRAAAIMPGSASRPQRRLAGTICALRRCSAGDPVWSPDQADDRSYGLCMQTTEKPGGTVSEPGVIARLHSQCFAVGMYHMVHPLQPTARPHRPAQ